METLRNTLRPLPFDDYFLLQLFMRDAEDRMTMSTFSDPVNGFEWAMKAAKGEGVASWQLRRWDGTERRMVMAAVSTNWFTLPPKKLMNPPPVVETDVVDDCRVEIGLEGRVCIYFTPAVPRLHDSYLKITHRRHMVIEGNVTPHNYNGFLRAVALAPRYMEPT